ncbi:MAG TPA: phosphate signaling complex protein PhoU [Candidatus Syntrophosphaera sp.]|nr:phosphate signaling complex protein PhoU [Candidatus Syntrophosphaera sp.]
MLESKILELKQMLLTEAGLVEKMATLAADGLYSRQNGLLRIVNEYEDRVNQLELEIENKCIAAIALYQPEAKDLRKIVMILKINNDLERLGDQAVNIAESAEHLAGKAVVSQVSELAQMRDAAFAMLKNSLDAFAAENVEASRAVCDADDKVDELNRLVYHRLVELIKHDTPLTESCLHLLRVAKNLERIADLSTNVAENTVYLAVGKVIKHHQAEENPPGKT